MDTTTTLATTTTTATTTTSCVESTLCTASTCTQYPESAHVACPCTCTDPSSSSTSTGGGGSVSPDSGGSSYHPVHFKVVPVRPGWMCERQDFEEIPLGPVRTL